MILNYKLFVISKQLYIEIDNEIVLWWKITLLQLYMWNIVLKVQNEPAI